MNLRLFVTSILALLAARSLALDLQIDATSAPGVSFSAYYGQDRPQTLEFKGTAYIRDSPCLYPELDGVLRARLTLTEVTDIVYESLCLCTTMSFADAELVVEFEPNSTDGSHGASQVVFRAKGPDFQIIENQEWGGIEFYSQLGVTERAPITQSCKFGETDSVFGPHSWIWGSMTREGGGESPAWIHAAIRADDSILRVANAHPSWSRLKAMYANP